MTGSILVYGATGYTGKLVAQVSRAKGSNVILAGRKRTWRTRLGRIKMGGKPPCAVPRLSPPP